jgi:hypothetical protein
MEHAKIVQKVRDILNEHGGDDGLSIATDRVLLDEYIESAIPDAVIMLAQKGYRVNAVSFSNIAGAVTDVVSEDLIFDDFISLIYASSPSWIKPVTELTDVNSPQFKMAKNPYTAPGYNNPIGYSEVGGSLFFLPDMDRSENPVRIRGFYNAKYNPYKADAETGEMVVDENYELKADPKEATAVCYMTAALVLGMFGDDQGKQRLSDISTNMLQ